MKKTPETHPEFFKRKQKRLAKEHQLLSLKRFMRLRGKTSIRKAFRLANPGLQTCAASPEMAVFHQANGTFSRALWIHFVNARTANENKK